MSLPINLEYYFSLWYFSSHINLFSISN